MRKIKWLNELKWTKLLLHFFTAFKMKAANFCLETLLSGANVFMSFFFFFLVINAIIDPTGNLDIVTSNKASSAAKPSTATKVRTANNSGSTLETLSLAQMRNYAQKSNCGSSSLQESNFIPDGEKYVIWYNILYCCYTVIYCCISIVYEWFVDSLCGAVV